jgi:predicted Zn-dependent peptidase
MPVTFEKQRLANGLTVIAEIDPSAHSAACGFFVKTGARDEATPVMGVSHFLEHMMFKGTDDISAEELNRRFDAMGARNNAFTSTEMTCFYATTLPERLADAVDLLGRMMRPALRESDFETEKGVILEEIAMYRDNPFSVLYDACVERHFEGHPLAHRILGTPESIKALTAAQMREYFDRRYSSDNTTVALSGRVDFDRAVREVERVCGAWRATGADRDAKRPAPRGGRVTLTDEKVNRGDLLALCDAPALEDDRRYAASLLAQVLGAPDNSRLHWSLIETGIAEDAQAAFDAHDGVGQYYVFASGDPERLGEIETVIGRELESLVASVTDDDLVRLRNKSATAATLGGERPTDRMHRLGRLWTCLGVYRPLEDELERICAVTISDLADVARAYPLRPQTLGTLVKKI